MGDEGERMWVWSKSVSAEREEWWERELEGLPAGSWVVVRSAFRRRVQLRAYGGEGMVRGLVERYGGRCRELGGEWERALRMQTRVVAVRGKLWVYGEREAWEEARGRGERAMWIPASMAFGTGHHPTTGRCLRLLADLAGRLQAGRWHMADVGCGSGILGIAGKLLGAGSVEALDYDPVCVQETRRNAERNGVRLERVELEDVMRWEPMKGCDVIAANLLSETLMRAGERLAGALAEGGTLIVSGVMRFQWEEVAGVLRGCGLRVWNANSRGKWVSALARKGGVMGAGVQMGR